MWRRVTFQMVKGDGLPGAGSRSGRQASCGTACADGCLHYILSAKLHNFSVKKLIVREKMCRPTQKNKTKRIIQSSSLNYGIARSYACTDLFPQLADILKYSFAKANSPFFILSKAISNKHEAKSDILCLSLFVSDAHNLCFNK